MSEDPDEQAHIDSAVESWASLVPDLDVDTMRIALLMGRATMLGRKHVETAFNDCGLTSGEFDVLASLLHAPDNTSKPSVLARSGMLSSAGMTHRLDLLEESGWLERRPDPGDRRSTLVVLTLTGKDKAIEAARAHVAAEHDLIGPLGDAERQELTRLLELLLGAYSTPAGAASKDPQGEL